MKRPSRILIICLFVLFASLTKPLSALGQGANSPPVRIPLSGTAPFHFFNDCTGEYVSGIVAFKGQITQTTTSSGQNHLTVREVDQGYAKGETTGIQYVAPQTLHLSQAGTETFPFTETFMATFRVVSKGSSSNGTFTETFHLTVNANGQTTVVFDKVTAICQ